MRTRSWIRSGLVALILAVPLILTTGAEAAFGLTPLANFTSPTVPGQEAPATFTITNNSDGREAANPVTVTSITLIPSCGSSVSGCPAPDPNVFQLNGPFVGTGTGVCPTSYTVSVINAATGEVLFTPVGGPPVIAVGQLCRIDFTTTTLRVPTIDVAPGTPGVQTNDIGFATGTTIDSDGVFQSGLGFGSNAVTVNRAPATITTQATPRLGDPGQSFSDVATVAGPLNAPTPTGTVTFQLFVRTPPAAPGGPATCGAPVGPASPAMDLVAMGPTTAQATSPASTPPVGDYVFVATYSGDANFLGSTSACSDDAERVTVNPLPTIIVLKTPRVDTLPEPGGVFTYDVLVTNTSNEPVTITALTDNVYGNLVGPPSNPPNRRGTSTCVLGAVLAPDPDGADPQIGGTYPCSFQGTFTGLAGDAETDVVTATAVDTSGNTATATDDATVILNPAGLSILVDKTVVPGSRPEPGGVFRFTVVTTNTSPIPLRVTALTDDQYGNLIGPATDPDRGATTCIAGTLLQPTETYTCAFDGTFIGVAGDRETDLVTVTGTDAADRNVSDTDEALVTLTPAVLSITVDKTVAPGSLPQPGGEFTFTVVTTNTSPIPLRVTALTDSVYGNLIGAPASPRRGTTTCVAGTLLQPGQSYTCTFKGTFTGGGGATETDVVTVTATDSGGRTVTDSDDAVVTITDVPPTVLVDKTASPLTLPEPGGTFTFNVRVTNTSVEKVTITQLTDNIYGNISTKGTCTNAVGTVLDADPDGAGPLLGGVYTCSFPGLFNGTSGASQTDVVTVTVEDDNGTRASDTDDAVVTITPKPPAVPIEEKEKPPAVALPGLLPRTGAQAARLVTLAGALVLFGTVLVGSSTWAFLGVSRPGRRRRRKC